MGYFYIAMTKSPGRIIRVKTFVLDHSFRGIRPGLQSIMVAGECGETGFFLLTGLEVKRSGNAERIG